MGCLKNIIKSIILALAIVGFLSLGGKELVTNWWNNLITPSKDVMIEKIQKFGNFTNVSEEYEIDKTASMFGYSGVLAEHKATGQKLVIVDSSNKPLLTPEDFKDNQIDEKLQSLAKKYRYKALTINDLEITKRGSFKAYGNNAPYVRFNAKIKQLPISDVSGMISAVKTDNNETRVLISLNEKNKYSQVITEEFFKKIK